MPPKNLYYYSEDKIEPNQINYNGSKTQRV